MDQQGFVARLRAFLDELGSDTTDATPAVAPVAESTPPTGAAVPHSLDAPDPVSAPVAPAADSTAPSLAQQIPPFPSPPSESTPSPSSTPGSLPPAGAAVPHSLDVPAPVETQPATEAVPVVTPDPMPSGPAESESLIASSSIAHEKGDVVYLGDGAFGIVVSVRREGVMVSRLAAPEGPIADV
jgi:hypothetical protein